MPFQSFLHCARGKNLVRKRSVLNLLIEIDDLFLTFQIVRGYEVTVLNFKPAWTRSEALNAITGEIHCAKKNGKKTVLWILLVLYWPKSSHI